MEAGIKGGDRAMQRDWFSGAVLIAKNGQAVFAEAFG
jgi:hypothetical protein